MFLIAGLGNPGKKYEKTRHNVGFETLDRIIDENHIGRPAVRFHALIGKGTIGAESVLCVKPLTYMNASGEAVQPIAAYYKIDPESQLIVISDDVDLPAGALRIRRHGSAGGHNGLKSVISCLGTDRFIRVRVGVGAKPEGWDLADYVLGRFSEEDRKKVNEAMERAAGAVACIVGEGPDRAMNLYNG